MTDEPAAIPGLDGPVAAPDHHRVVFENAHVRVVTTVIPPGETAPLHTHATPHLTIMTSGDALIRRSPTGEVLLQVRPGDGTPDLPRYSWSDGLPPHTLENTGLTSVIATSVEVKGLR